jgi:hypothetical protein
VLAGDPNLPNGGLASRFAGLYIPILDLTFNGPAATDTQFDTVEINREYDGFSDLPLYPLNVISLANALLGVVYSHMYILDVSLPADPTKSPAYQGKHGDTSYYYFENPDLPLFGPLRTLGVPEPVIDVFEPFFKVIVDLGYDRSIPSWEPTPARLFPTLDPAKVAGDLVEAIGEGIDNAAALIGLPPKPSVPAPVTLAAPATEAEKAAVSPEVTLSSTPTQTQQVTVDTNDDRNPVDDVDGNEDGNGDRTQLVSSTPAGPSELSTTATPAPSTSAATPKPTKPADKPAKPRLSDRSDRGERDHPTTRTAAAGAGATTAAHSATGDSSGDPAGSD